MNNYSSGSRENGYDLNAGRSCSGAYSGMGYSARCPLCKRAPQDSHIGKYSSSNSGSESSGVPVVSTRGL
jgi:hypothetical protein